MGQVCSTTIEEIHSISPTVKQLTLQVHQDNFLETTLTFFPGQSLLLLIPDIRRVGRYNIVSTPKDLEIFNQIKVAIKYSNNSPSHWIHTKCKEGSKLKVHVKKNDQFYLPSTVNWKKILFIPGGVGINPIMSMISHLHEIKLDVSLTLLYSVKCKRELLFKKRLDEMAKNNPKFQLHYRITCKELNPNIRPPHWKESFQYEVGRLTSKEVDKYMDKDIVTLVCAPSELIDLVLKSTNQCKEILYEKW